MYNDNKLVQIMATPKPMKAIYSEENGVQLEVDILCMGLTELGDVVFLTVDDMGVVSDVTDAENFITVIEGNAAISSEEMKANLNFLNTIKF